MSGTITIEVVFTSRETAEAFMRQYLQQYHPLGYGTSLKLEAIDDAGEPATEDKAQKWRVSGWRAKSCD